MRLPEIRESLYSLQIQDGIYDEFGSSIMVKKPLKSMITIAAIGAGMALASPAPVDAAKAVQSFFNSKEIRSSNLKPFKKWTGALLRYSKEVALHKSGNCKSKEFNACHYKAWMKFLVSIKDKDKISQIKAVNAYMNRAKYITDSRNWGQKDYWASPGQFMEKFGDCEDYAIAKFMSLKLLGFSSDMLRVAAVKDLNLKVGHAILVVIVDGKYFLLDNQIKQVVETKTVRHYRPVFSISTQYWWRHRLSAR